MMDQPTIHVVDDDADFRKSITRLLHLSGYAALQYASAQQFLDEFKDDSPGCVLLDLDMPKINGLQLLDRLQQMHATLPIVFLSGRGNIASGVKAIKGGAEDFLCKPASRKDVLAAIERAMGRNRKMREKRAQLDDCHSRLNTLTPREKQVYALVVVGKLNKQIAHEPSTTERTIKAHRQKVMHKLHAQTVVELVSFAERLTALDK